jgi:hypothetical protein
MVIRKLKSVEKTETPVKPLRVNGAGRKRISLFTPLDGEAYLMGQFSDFHQLFSDFLFTR